MLVIFDCDGVLIDSEFIFCSVDADALTELGHPTTPAAIFQRFAGVPHRVAWKQLDEELKLGLPDDWVDAILQECDRRFETELRPIPGAADAIAAIRDQGHEICVASSTELPALVANLQRTGLLGHVEPHVFSASQVKRPKPAPDIFLFAASQMGLDPGDAVVVEDSIAGVTAAKRAGMKALGFTGGRHVFEQLDVRLVEAGADSVCSSMSDVVGFLDPRGDGSRQAAAAT